MTVAKDGVPSAAAMQADYEASLRKRGELYGTAPSTVDALMYSLRERGTAALQEPDTQRRLGELTPRQMIDVGVRLQTFSPAWTTEQVEALFAARAKL
jgi:hypothetical protein